MNKEVASLKNVSVKFDEQYALRENTLSIQNGDFLGIIGPNGGGKTTLLRVILGLVAPCSGEVSVFGDTPKKMSRQIGYVPQISFSDKDFPISVRDVVLMGRITQRPMFKKFNKEDHQAAQKALETVEMISQKDRQIGELSGGQRQRVLIARALASNPKLLLLDEPTANIDPEKTTDIYKVFSELKKDMAIVLVTHDVGAISSYVDKIACLNEKLYYHNSKEICPETLEKVYGCPVDLIAHGTPHRVLHHHH